MNFFRDPDFRAVVGRERARLFGGLLVVFGRSGIGVWQPLLIGAAIDSIYSRAPVAETSRVVLLYLACATGAGICQYWMRLWLVAISRDVELEIRSSLFRKLLSLSASFFDRSRTGDLMSRLTSDVEAVRMGAGPGVMYLADTGLRTIGALALMFMLSPVLTLWSLGPIVIAAYFMKGVLREVQELSLRVQEEQGTLSARAQESFSGARVVKAFARERAEERRFAALSETYVALNDRLARARALFTCLIETAGMAVMTLVLLVGGREVLAGRFTVGGLASFIAYLQMLVWPMIAVGWVLGLWQRAKASYGRLLEVRDEIPDVAEPDEPVLPPDGIAGAVEFRGLTFMRPGAETPALHDVRVKIPAKSSLGIIGRTGSGKTTLVQFVARLAEPPPGTVLIDGVDVRRLPLGLLRRSVGFVPQETLLFSDTIEANVAFGLDEPAAEAIAEAVRRSCLDEAVATFPDGLKTIVGERGVTLSGGQRQRTAVARALAIDPKILVLDDCLSAVDAETEERILSRLAEVIHSRTTLVVSHRASAVMRLDRVLVMEEGRVVEYGAPEELIEAGGPFAELAKMQQTAEELESL